MEPNPPLSNMFKKDPVQKELEDMGDGIDTTNKGIKATNFILWINTIFTVVSGIGIIIISLLTLQK